MLLGLAIIYSCPKYQRISIWTRTRFTESNEVCEHDSFKKHHHILSPHAVPVTNLMPTSELSKLMAICICPNLAAHRNKPAHILDSTSNLFSAHPSDFK